MLFSSLVFLWIFLPIVLFGNFLIGCLPIDYNKKIKFKNFFLLIASFIFYGYGNIKYLFLMLFSIMINFLGGFLISTGSFKKFFLVITIIINLLLLFYFKYFNMLVIVIEQMMSQNNNLLMDMINMKGTGSLGIKEIVLPIGISFFTFQAMSYVVDVYRNDCPVQKSLINFALYVALFPQLIAGPIVQYNDIEKQIHIRRESVDRFIKGQKRFLYGFAKKVLLANTFAKVVDEIWLLDLNKLGFPIAFLCAICYTFQIYYDFSGYSDMAIGLGKMFGFRFKENFDYPYMSTSITEFWRRWHISLSSWFKNYVYIPLGGSRKGLFKTCRNLFLVFLLTGIWHGANWTFVFFGISYGLLVVIERLFLLKFLNFNKIKIINFLYVCFVVNVLFILFRSPNILSFVSYIQQFTTFESNYTILTYLSMKLIICLICGFLFMGVIQTIFRGFYEKCIVSNTNKLIFVLDYTLQIVLFLLSILTLASGTYNPFIYFQF